MVVRTMATVCSSDTMRASSRGAEPKTSAVSCGDSFESEAHSRKAEIPACATRETHARSSADSWRYQG